MSVTVQAWDGHKATTGELGDVLAMLAAGSTVWIDSEGTPDGLSAFLTETLHLHPLAVEDILESQTTPKVEDYGDYVYVVAHSIRADTKPLEIETMEFDLVFSSKWIFTHHSGPSGAVQSLTEALKRNPRTMQRGPAFVAHALIDRMVDDFLPVVDALDDHVDAVEVDVIENPSSAVLQRIFALKKSLQAFRRMSVHQREILQRLSRGEFELIPAEALPFYRDVFDHFGRVADLADGYRELLSSVLDAYLSVVSNRMNEVMKTLTIVATLMMPMTLVAGIYGMNFQNMPELHWKYGYAYSWVVLGVIFFGMMGWFRKRGWV